VTTGGRLCVGEALRACGALGHARRGSLGALAIDRAHRPGEASKVFAYRLIPRGTIEEKVLALQERKRELAASIFEGESASPRGLTREDLEPLLAP
jgi:SNF2 family DNA or RNA helicase